MAGTYRFPAEDHPDSPWPIFERVLQFPELELQANLVGDHEIQFAFALRYETSDGGWTRGERRVLGTAQMPRVSGALSDLFDQLLGDVLGYEPHFLILLNGDWWDDANDREREILVVHELLHCGQATDAFGAPKFRRSDNAPILAMIGHDVEEFDAVARRYGAWKSDLVSFREALEEGEGRRSNGGPTMRFDIPDGAEGLRVYKGGELVAEAWRDPPEVIKTSPSDHPEVISDADLPPDVGPVDPELGRDIPPQDESAPDLF